MAGRGRVQIHRCVRAAGQPRHRVPLPLLLLHTAATFFDLREVTTTCSSTRGRPSPCSCVALQPTSPRSCGLLLTDQHASTCYFLLFVKFNRTVCSMATVASSCASSALEEQWAISRTDIPSNHLTKYQ
ncbi:hypothetical protein EJB05_15434, partial [Eragrostis curvula]